MYKMTSKITGFALILSLWSPLLLAAPCTVSTPDEFAATTQKIKDSGYKDCLDEKGKSTVDIMVVNDAENYLRWHLSTPLSLPGKIRYTSNGRISLVADYSGPAAPVCMVNINEENTSIDNIVFLNNIPNKNFLGTICIGLGAKNTTIQDSKIIVNAGPKPAYGISDYGTATTITKNRIKNFDGIAINLQGKQSILTDNKIDELGNFTAVLIYTNDATIRGNVIYAKTAFQFEAPLPKRSTAANIIQTNPSLFYDPTGEYDEELAAENNFKEAYANFCLGYGCTGDLVYCNGVPYGTAPYVEGQDSLTCIATPAPAPAALACPVAQVVCPLGGKVENGICIVEKIVEKEVIKSDPALVKPNDSIQIKTLGPLQPVVASGTDASCSLSSSASAGAPALLFLGILTLAGLMVCRTVPKKLRIRNKERFHD